MSTTSPLEYEARIRALERINATLAAEVDIMQPVVDAARAWYNGAENWSVTLAEQVAIYEASKAVNHGR